jgi:ankyrin repeat protein
MDLLFLSKNTNSSTTRTSSSTTTTTSSDQCITESPLLWIHGTGPGSRGSVLVILAQNGYTKEAHTIIGLSRTASLIGRDSNGGLPELWDIMGKVKGKNGITRLMAICITRGSLSPQRARALITDHTVDVNETDSGGRTALYHALGAIRCRSDRWPIDIPLSAELIHVLFEMDPKGVLRKDQFSSIPFHYACQKNAPIDVIKLFLTNDYKESVKIKDSNSSLPLHLSCSMGVSIEIIKLLLEFYPEGIKEKDEYSNLPLHCACEINDSSIEVIKFLVTLYPNGLKERLEDGSLPLHLACENNLSIDNIKYLIENYPDGIKEKKMNGSLPLHLACESTNSLDVIKLLISFYPSSIYERNIDGKLPFYYTSCPKRRSFSIKQRLVQPSFDVLKFFLEIDPTLVQEKIESDLPLLHWACSRNAPLDVLKVILDAYPDAIQICDSQKGYLPLHFACFYKSSLEILQFLIKVYPESIQQTDKLGKLPLHLSCSNTTSLSNAYSNTSDSIQFLYSLYKDGAFVTDIFGKVPAQYLREYTSLSLSSSSSSSLSSSSSSSLLDILPIPSTSFTKNQVTSQGE